MPMGFTITCGECDSIRVGLWSVSQDGEYVGARFKCDDCGNESEPY